MTQLSSKIVNKVYEFGDMFFIKHNISGANAKYESVGFSNEKEIKFMQNSHVQFKGIKVEITNLGKIKKIGE